MAKKHKLIKQTGMISAFKQARYVETPESFYDKSPVWSFKWLDNNYTKWGFVHVSELNSSVINKLKDYEGMTWDEIIKATGGRKRGNNNHYEKVSDLISEAVERWKTLKLEEYDQVFSLSLSGTERLYGILSDGIFRIVWYDKNHEIYPMKR